MMKVWVYSPSRVLAEALAELVKSFGFEAHLEQEPQSEVALWDLTSTFTLYPSPPALPTLALVLGENVEDKIIDLLNKRYRGYIVSSEDRHVLKRALEAVRRGEIWARREMLTRTFDSFIAPQLTAREKEIVYLVAAGLSNRAIAQQLGITERTVKSHVSNLFVKLGVNSRTELILNPLNRAAYGSKRPGSE